MLDFKVVAHTCQIYESSDHYLEELFMGARAKNRAEVGRVSRALISKLVERKGEGASAEGYKADVRLLPLTAK